MNWCNVKLNLTRQREKHRCHTSSSLQMHTEAYCVCCRKIAHSSRTKYRKGKLCLWLFLWRKLVCVGIPVVVARNSMMMTIIIIIGVHIKCVKLRGCVCFETTKSSLVSYKRKDKTIRFEFLLVMYACKSLSWEAFWLFLYGAYGVYR